MNNISQGNLKVDAERRIIFLNGELSTINFEASFPTPTEDEITTHLVSGAAVADALINFDQESKAPIKLIIDSPGGDVDEGFTIIDTIALIRSQIWAYVRVCGSMATVIMAMGEIGHRYVLPHANIHIHASSLQLTAKQHDAESIIASSRYIENAAYDIFLKRTKLLEYIKKKVGPFPKWKSDRQILESYLKDERFFSPREAIAAGMVDGIVTKRIHRKFFK